MKKYIYIVLHEDGQDSINGFAHSSVRAVYENKQEAERFVASKSTSYWWIKEVIIGEEIDF